MTNYTSLESYQPVTELNVYNVKHERRTPSPAEATLAESLSTGTMMMSMTDEYSPIPGGVDASSQSSPGSASDHMGALPTAVNIDHSSTNGSKGIQPLFPGSSVLAAFDAGNPNLCSQAPSIPTTSRGTIVKSPVLARRKGGTATPSSKASNSVASNTTADAAGNNNNPNRRQSRLQRNRESARLSRKRRKQYLELLEERVDKLSETLDQSRRHHVAIAVTTLSQKRNELMCSGIQTDINTIHLLENNLSRTNEELMIATTFQYQQLKSFSTPPSMQFTLWLTLQTDTYFRGGRTASERLSAARIGERMLSSGTESAAPSQSMWPLFCNEIGLSYDQEEKLRAIQRTLIQDQNTWVDRHTAYASRKVIESSHDATQALTFRLGHRERSTIGVLSNEQRMKLMNWTVHNRNRVAQSTVSSVPTIAPQRAINSQYHVAANLYILNDQLMKILTTIPRAAPLLTGAALKRLSHRPSFEPLGASDERSNDLSREGSFPSSGSLKRNASEMSMDGDDSSNCVQKAQIPTITPVDAQLTAIPFVQQALCMVQDLLPPEPPVETMMSTLQQDDGVLPEPVLSTTDIPIPVPVTSTSMPIPSIIYQAPAAYTQSAPSFGALLPPHAQHHVRKSSFLPAHLNVVPEEMWPDEADDFLLDMIEGDWAIGEGIDMDMNE